MAGRPRLRTGLGERLLGRMRLLMGVAPLRCTCSWMSVEPERRTLPPRMSTTGPELRTGVLDLRRGEGKSSRRGGVAGSRGARGGVAGRRRAIAGKIGPLGNLLLCAASVSGRRRRCYFFSLDIFCYFCCAIHAPLLGKKKTEKACNSLDCHRATSRLST